MRRPPLMPALVAEFLGTALLVLLIDGVVASVVLLDKRADWTVITAGCGLAVALSVYLTGRISGGHLNPAVTLALAVRREFPATRVAPYWLAQLAGAMAGAGLVYADYFSAFLDFEQARGIVRGAMAEGKLAGSAAGGVGVFCTFPAYGNTVGNFFSEVLGTAVLLLGIRALTDRRNAAPGRGFEPLMVGLLVTAIGLSLGGLTGFAINPARDLGPRIVAGLCGWGLGVFTSHDAYFWVPLVGPMVGGLIGVGLYDGLIAPHLPQEDEPAPAGTAAP